MDYFIESGMAEKQIGQTENHKWNQVAYIKAIRNKLQLSELYGLNDHVLLKNGFKVDLFRALLSMELSSAFFEKEYILPFNKYLNEMNNWQSALRQLAMNGVLQNNQNRFPFTWSERMDKIKNIKSWTVSDEFPYGNIHEAEAILDFWTVDLASYSSDLPNSKKTTLTELPFIKIGKYIFQLPWVVAFQNNSFAALNNLRRIGCRRAEIKDETQRMELQLSKKFGERGFHVILNYSPEKNLILIQVK